MKTANPDTWCQCGHAKKHHHNDGLIGCVICGCRKFVLPKPASKLPPVQTKRHLLE